MAADETLSQDRKLTARELVPAEIQDAIKKGFPKSRIVELSDLEEGLRQQFAHASNERHPAYVGADFNGDGMQDYAVLLRSEQAGQPLIRLVVLLREKKGGFKAQTLEKFTHFLESIVIGSHSPGTVQEHDSNKIIVLKFPGIERRFFEKSAGIYYWDEKRFRYIQTED